MPITPSPGLDPVQFAAWSRWATAEIQAMTREFERQRTAGANINATQNSTMTMLVERLGNVQDSITELISTTNFDATRITSGVLDIARIPGLDTSRIPSLDASKITSGTLTQGVDTAGSIDADGDGRFGNSWNYNIVINRRSAWIDENGKLGHTASSERFKKEIQSWSPDMQAVLAMQLVRFQWDAEALGKEPEEVSDEVEYGLIAEQLCELGLEWLVFFDSDGLPAGIHYERIALALLPVIQDHNVRLETMEAKLASLEESLNANT